MWASQRELTDTKRQRQDEKSDMWSLKNPNHFIINVTTSLWTDLKKQKDVRWYFQVNERKFYCLINCCLPSMELGGVSLAQKSKSLLDIHLVTNLLPLFKNSQLPCLTIFRTYCYSSYEWPFIVGHIVEYLSY